MKVEKARDDLRAINSDIFDIIGMTEIQARRADMFLKGLSINEIAKDEKVDKSGVVSSIESAIIKVRKAMIK